MPQNPSRNLFKICGLLLLVGHFVLVGVYCLPDQSQLNAVRPLSNTYTVPFFHQGWQLFAPNPPAFQGRLKALCSVHGDLIEISPGESNSLPDHYRIERIIHRLQKQLENEMRKNLYYDDNDSIQYDLVLDSWSHSELLYFIGKQVEREHGVLPDSVKWTLVLDRIPKYPEDKNDQRTYSFPWHEVVK